jgi:hypothetical protein
VAALSPSICPWPNKPVVSAPVVPLLKKSLREIPGPASSIFFLGIHTSSKGCEKQRLIQKYHKLSDTSPQEQSPNLDNLLGFVILYSLAGCFLNRPFTGALA